MGLVIELYKGRDGFKRGCKLRTVNRTGQRSILNRPTNKLYPLEIPTERPSGVRNEVLREDNIVTDKSRCEKEIVTDESFSDKDYDMNKSVTNNSSSNIGIYQRPTR